MKLENIVQKTGVVNDGMTIGEGFKLCVKDMVAISVQPPISSVLLNLSAVEFQRQESLRECGCAVVFQ